MMDKLIRGVVAIVIEAMIETGNVKKKKKKKKNRGKINQRRLGDFYFVLYTHIVNN